MDTVDDILNSIEAELEEPAPAASAPLPKATGTGTRPSGGKAEAAPAGLFGMFGSFKDAQKQQGGPQLGFPSLLHWSTWPLYCTSLQPTACDPAHGVPMLSSGPYDSAPMICHLVIRLPG